MDTLARPRFKTNHHADRAPETPELLAIGRLDEAAACKRAASSAEGLTSKQARARLKRYGPNVVAREGPPPLWKELWRHAKSPLNALLLGLALISYVLHDVSAALIVFVIVCLAVLTSFVQEHRSSAAAARLRSLVKTTASVHRHDFQKDEFKEVPLEALVPGDIVRLSAGDMIPADLRLIEAKDLFINQSALTGESMPVEKFAHSCQEAIRDPFDLPNMCFMGANVSSGYGTGVIVRTGGRTFFGALADKVLEDQQETAFDRGVNRFVWLMLRVIGVMVPLVFVVNGLTKHDWLEALLFAVAVAVGLAPEMLPMIVTVNLAHGALAMSHRKVIVKRLNAIQNLGAMDVLCSDKTGTLTQDRIILKRHLDLHGKESDRVLHYAWLNSHYQSGLKNLLDVAVLEHMDLHDVFGVNKGYAKIDEVPFDFSRRRMSVVVTDPRGMHLLICKGAVEEICAVCTAYESDGQSFALDACRLAEAQAQTRLLGSEGFRVVAVAYKELANAQPTYSASDEHGLTLLGYIAFLDPPKDSARTALRALSSSGVTVKILTGDNEAVTRHVCQEVGLDAGNIVLGSAIDEMSPEQLALAAEHATVFAKLTPAHKQRIVQALRSRDHVVGFLGDGINDSPALKGADVGISVDSAVDIAKESADIILLEKSLLVLQEGVIEGRKVFCNITKYIRMSASSNFGNMLSVLGASLFLPFLPMAPVQVLANNLLYDFSQTAIPTDNVDDEEVAFPRKWHISDVFRYMVTMGPISSLFDYATYAAMLWWLHAGRNPSLFQTGWFVESLLTQTLIVHIIRTSKIPFVQSRASHALIASTGIICAIGIFLPFSALGHLLGFQPLPWAYWPVLVVLLTAYAFMAHWGKRRLTPR